VRRRPAVTILVLIIAVILPLPMQAQQRIVAPTVRSARVDVAPGFSPAPRLSRSRQPMQIRFPNMYGAGLKPGATTDASSPAKPFTQEQVSKMVQAGLGDDSGAKLIEQRGIDFAPSEDFYQTLKAAGASEAFLNALHVAIAQNFSSARAELKFSATTAPPEPATAKKPLNQVQVFALLARQVPDHRVATLVEERSIDFEPQQEYLDEVSLGAGGLGQTITFDVCASQRALLLCSH